MDKDFMKFLNELEGVTERIDKTNKQRLNMVLVLNNIMRNEATPLHLKASIAASMMDMLDSDMIPEDTPIINVLNESIEFVCTAAEEIGVYNLREHLNKIRKDCDESANRQKDGENILKSLNLNNINLN